MKPEKSPDDPDSSYRLEWTHYYREVHERFSDLYKDKEFSDVDIICNDRVIKGHKLILSSFSSVLKKQFADGAAKIHLPDVDSLHMDNLLSFMYRGQLEISREDMGELLSLARVLKVSGLWDEEGDGMLLVHQRTNPDGAEANRAKQLKIAQEDQSQLSWYLEDLMEMPSPQESAAEPVSLEANYTGIGQDGYGAWKCLECGKVFSTKQTANRHLKHIHRRDQQKTGKCHICSKIFPNLDYLKKHLRGVHNLGSGSAQKKQNIKKET